MQFRPLGQSDIQASIIGLGTWAMGGWKWGGSDESAAIDAIHASLDSGVNLIDTAPVYGMGYSEEVVGKAIAGRRSEVVLATKCGLVWGTGQGYFHLDQEGTPINRYLGGDSIRREVEQSLIRLKTDYIDLLQTHWQDAKTPIEETMQALLDLKKEGKIRAIGVSNATTDHMDAYQALGPLDSDQEKYSMLDRKIENTVLPYTREHNIAVLAYSPLELGLLTGKVGPEREFASDDHRSTKERFSIENRQRVQELLDGFKPVAEKHNLTLAQLVIAWSAAQPGVTHILVGARNRQQALENAAAGSVMLSDEDLQQMNAVIEARRAEIV